MKKKFLTLFLLFSMLFSFSQGSVMTCSCMTIDMHGKDTCTTGVSYTIEVGSGGCCSENANSATLANIGMSGNLITSIDVSIISGADAQDFCC